MGIGMDVGVGVDRFRSDMVVAGQPIRRIRLGTEGVWRRSRGLQTLAPRLDHTLLLMSRLSLPIRRVCLIERCHIEGRHLVAGCGQPVAAKQRAQHLGGRGAPRGVDDGHGSEVRQIGSQA